MLADLPAPLIAFSGLALVTTPLVYYDARKRGSDRARLWALFTLVTFGHGALVYLLERDDPGERVESGGEYVLPGEQQDDSASAEPDAPEPQS